MALVASPPTEENPVKYDSPMTHKKIRERALYLNFRAKIKILIFPKIDISIFPKYLKNKIILNVYRKSKIVKPSDSYQSLNFRAKSYN